MNRGNPAGAANDRAFNMIQPFMCERLESNELQEENIEFSDDEEGRAKEVMGEQSYRDVECYLEAEKKKESVKPLEEILEEEEIEIAKKEVDNVEEIVVTQHDIHPNVGSCAAS